MVFPHYISPEVTGISDIDCADLEVLSYITITGGINVDIVRDLITETIEYRFRIEGEFPHPFQLLIDNGPSYKAHETRDFALAKGLE